MVVANLPTAAELIMIESKFLRGAHADPIVSCSDNWNLANKNFQI